MKNIQQEHLKHEKISCEFNVAYAFSQNYKLRYSMSGLTKQEFEFQQSENKLREQIRLQKQKNNIG